MCQRIFRLPQKAQFHLARFCGQKGGHSPFSSAAAALEKNDPMSGLAGFDSVSY